MADAWHHDELGDDAPCPEPVREPVGGRRWDDGIRIAQDDLDGRQGREVRLPEVGKWAQGRRACGLGHALLAEIGACREGREASADGLSLDAKLSRSTIG